MLTNESLLGELQSESSCDLLKFVFRVFLRVDLDAGLGATEGHVDARTLEGHQSGQGFNFVPRHVR